MRALIFIAILLAGCSEAGDPPSMDPSGTWELVAGAPVVADHPITLILDSRGVSGTAGCNGYGASLADGGGGIALAELSLTAMLCDIPGVMEAEEAYVAALARVTSMRMDGDALVLAGQGIELRFERLADAPLAELVNTPWVLESLFVGDVASPPLGEPATLRLVDDGTFTGSTGCRSFTGTWIATGNQVSATSMAMDDRVCPAGQADQDSQVISVIGDGFVPAVDAGMLTLSDPGGIGLVYRAQGE